MSVCIAIGLSENEVTYYYRDHLGGTNVTTDADGNLKELIEYKPYGEFARREMYGDGADVAWFYFTGKPKDDETGLYYYGARYYDPSIGRFITADSMVQAPDNPQTLNRYAYSGNNPVNFVDPNGHWFWAALIVGSILGGTSATINDQPVWQGVLMGAAGGIMVGAGASAFGFWGAVGGGMLAGAGSAGITGGNVGFGALVGGLGAGLGYGLGSWAGGWNEGSFWGSLGAAAISGGVAGGVGAELAGGEFGEGAWMGAAFSTGGFFGAKAVNSLDPRVSRARKYERESRRRHNLNVKKNDMIKVDTGARPVGDTAANHKFVDNWEMGPTRGTGPDRKLISTSNTIKNLSKWPTNNHTQDAIARREAVTTTVEVSASGLVDAIDLYNSHWAGKTNYNAFSHNSNYAVNTVIYSAGGSVPGGLGWSPPFNTPPDSTPYFTYRGE